MTAAIIVGGLIFGVDGGGGTGQNVARRARPTAERIAFWFADSEHRP